MVHYNLKLNRLSFWVFTAVTVHVVFWDATLCILYVHMMICTNTQSSSLGLILKMVLACFRTLMSAYKTTQCDNSTKPKSKASNHLQNHFILYVKRCQSTKKIHCSQHTSHNSNVHCIWETSFQCNSFIIHSFIQQSVLRQVQSLFQIELFTQCDLELPPSNVRILSFP